jgi:uncharacterized membrane protein YedE/YeeE
MKMEWILQPWPWYVSGPLIGLMVPTLLLLAGRSFGVSSSFRHIGAMCAPRSRLSYLKDDDWRKNSWNLIFVLGIAIGGFVDNYLLSEAPVPFLPEQYYSLSGVIKLLIGGALVGFGTRYADGCTSGHTITGISNLNWVSMVATASFFVGGLITTFLLWPLLQF